MNRISCGYFFNITSSYSVGLLKIFCYVCFSQKVLSLTAAKALIKDEEYLEPVYNYWVKKHGRSCMNGLILTLKSEKKDASSPSDPYIAFRRRIEKMQTRKVGPVVLFRF